MRDIQTEADITLLVATFYKAVGNDALLAPAFTEVVPVDWDTHLPRMVQFWATILFRTPGYRGDPHLKHALLHRQMPLTRDHFTHWVALFSTTVDQLFAGERAEFAKKSAAQMGRGLAHNILGGVEVFNPEL